MEQELKMPAAHSAVFQVPVSGLFGRGVGGLILRQKDGNVPA